ncbi:MAG: GrpB family protein [Chloroflexi bacterium]|nr:MAG: GrpB family protein [Chloroflexota bacterium]
MSQALSDTIHLADYDPRWPQLFEEERARLQAAIGEWAADIQHVGSTSIPGIAAKPIIDIAVHLRSLVDALYCITPLMELGYECLGEFGIPGRIYFRKRTDQPRRGQSHDGIARTHQIHMYELRNEQYEKQIVFRDYLRAHPDAAREYEALKRQLAERHARDVEAYALAKSDFVLDILARARAAAAARSPLFACRAEGLSG